MFKTQTPYSNDAIYTLPILARLIRAVQGLH